VTSATDIVEAQLRVLQVVTSETRQRTPKLHLATFQLSHEDANDNFWDDDDSGEKITPQRAPMNKSSCFEFVVYLDFLAHFGI
jgi:hypothetical protein